MSLTRKKILVSAYAISPYKGSEFAVAWNFTLNLSQKYELWVLYGTSDEHLGDTHTMREYLKKNKIDNVNFIEIRPNTLIKAINYLNKIGLLWMFYFAFNLWQKKAYKIAKRLDKDINFHIVHQLVPIGYREPGYLWKINKPFVWGPIGGVKNKELHLLKFLSTKARILYLIKNLINYLQFNYSFRLKAVFKRSDSLIAATSLDAKKINEVYHRKSWHLPENGINAINKNINNPMSSEYTYFVWSGRHDENKNLKMLLKALIPLKHTSKIKVNILGEGILTNELKDFAQNNGLNEMITWYGYVSRDKAIEIMANSHIHIITSLGEANTTVLFEAMSSGIPTISLNHCGMQDIICEKCGIKINIDDYNQAVTDLTDTLKDLLNSPQKIRELKKGVAECAKTHLWENRNSMLNKIYIEAEENFKRNEKNHKFGNKKN